MKKTPLIVLGLAVCLHAACRKKKHHEAEPDYSAGINAFIGQAPLPLQPSESDTLQIGLPSTFQDGNYVCTEKKITLGYAMAQQYLLNPGQHSIYPGALLNGASVVNGTYTEIETGRAPLDISITLDNLKGSNVRTVPVPSETTVRDAITSLQNQGVYSSAPATMTFDYFDVSAPETLNNAIGATTAQIQVLSSPLSLDTKLTEALQYGSAAKKNKYVFRYSQVFYQAEAAQPASAAAFFAPHFSAEALSGAMDGYSMPLYVASVGYGRTIYFCLQSDASLSDLQPAWETAVGSVIGKGKIMMDPTFDLQAAVQKVPALNNCLITAVLISSSDVNGNAIVTKMDLATASNLIKTGSNYDNSASGIPVCFTLRCLADNSLFKPVNYNEYLVRNCVANKNTLLVKRFVSLSGENSPAGSVRITLGYTDTGLTTQSVQVWNNDGSPLDLNATGQVSVNPALPPYLSIDPLRRHLAYLKIDAGFTDIDDGNLEGNDYYSNVTVYYYFNGSNASLLTDSNGNYGFTMQSTTDYYYEMEKCCGLCAGQNCRGDRSRSQDARFNLYFNIL